jgi:hypothetical protein
MREGPLSNQDHEKALNKLVVGMTKPSVELWHSRLGHPSFNIVDYVLKNNELPFVQEASSGSVCDACQRAKSHQLPYKRSDSTSSHPLELVFSYVWGPAMESVGRYKYYVSFIDDFIKFTWLYLIKKSDVFQAFQSFQTHVERQFDRKILAVQTDWGGEYEKLNPFFQKIGIAYHVSCPHAHQQNGSTERKHMHIVEIDLALLAKASMPLMFWDEAFATAVRLVNVLPSQVYNSIRDAPKAKARLFKSQSVWKCMLAKSQALQLMKACILLHTVCFHCLQYYA